MEKIVDDERLVLPGDYPHTFFFVNTEMKWSPKTESFVSTSKRLQLGAINGKHVGQLLKGHIEILNDPVRGDIFSFYFVSPQGDWYYFSYQAGILKTISSNPSYVNLISSMKSKDKRIKSENGNYLEIVLATAAEYSAFKNKTIQAFTAEDTFDDDFDDSFDDFDEDDFDKGENKEEKKKEDEKKENDKKKEDVKTDINKNKDKTKKKNKEEEEEW